MRVVVSSEASRDVGQAELDRHLQVMSHLAASARGRGTSERVTLILRSAASAPAKALILVKDELAVAGVRAKAILAKLEPEDDLRQLFAALSELAPLQPAKELIRWARNPRLHDAHEQATYGSAMSWSGDPIRRDADKRNALDLFGAEDSGASRRAQHAFTALWRVSALVPERYLLARAVKPSGAYEQAAETPVLPLRPSIQGWPLVRH
jgi:hypothetical protein